MGVTDLWSVLDPVKKHLPLSSLRGQRLAVDLSIWICESQGVVQMERVISKPYLRNLFFRVNHLLLSGIDLVFIIDGRAPEMKAETMRKRQKECFLYRKSSQNNFWTCKNTKRSHLNAFVKKCCELLDCLGVPYLESQGEAEAYCAFLNKHGVVDACITNDGDAFLYGAPKIYRNFTMDRKDPHVESYTVQDIEQQLSLTQEKLVAFALLTGCDYQPKGIPQVGVETALKLLRALTNRDLLLRFRQWRSMKSSDCCCDIERTVWEKACKLPGFPSEQIIEEFLVSKDVLPKNNLQWKSPNMKKFENFMAVNLEWPKDYAVQKVLPLLTRWIMLEIVGLVTTKTRGLYLTPVKILKNRVCKGVQSVEVEWKISGSSENEAYVTVEDREMVGQCFPDLLEQFSQELKKKTKTKPASRISSKTKKSQPEANSAESQQVLLLSMEGLTLKPNEAAATQKTVKGTSEEFPAKREKHTARFACEPVLTAFNEESIRNCLSSVSQNEEPSSGAGLTNLRCNSTESSEPDISDDEYLPLKERIKNSCVQIQNHKPKKEMSRTSLLPSFTNSIKSETNSETDSKSRSQIRNSASVSMCSDQQTNTIGHGASIIESIDLTGNSYSSCPEIDSSNDEDSDDSLYLPVSHKLLNRYQISGESQNEDNFQSNQCLPLDSSQFPCDDSIKINHCERMEELNKSIEFSQKFPDNSAEPFDNSQLSKMAEITEQFFLLNVNEVEALSSNLSGMVSMATLQQCKDTVERSFGTDAKQLYTDAMKRSCSTDATQVCTDTVEKSTDATQVCTDTVERSFSTDATQLSTDTIKRSFSTDATQLCTDPVEGSFCTDATRLYTDIIERSFSTDATQLCMDIVERSFSTDATQLSTDTIEKSFNTDATQLCTDPVEGSFNTDATQLCTDPVEGSFNTDATQLCTDPVKGSFNTDATQLCTDPVEGSFCTDATLLCTDIVTDATQLCTNTLEVPSQTDAIQLLAENQSLHPPIKDGSRLSTKDTKFYSAGDFSLHDVQEGPCCSLPPSLKTSFNESLQHRNCSNTISNYSINGEDNASLLFCNSTSVSNTISDISNHSQTPEDSSMLFMNDKNSVSPDHVLKNSSLISNHCLNPTKTETASQHLENLSESVSDITVSENTVVEFHGSKTPGGALAMQEFPVSNKDPEEDAIPYSSFEDYSSIMDAVYNLTPDSLNSFSESRVGNFELISSLLDNSSEFKLDSDSPKISENMKTHIFNSTTNSGYKNQMEIKYSCRKNSLTNLQKNSCFILSPYISSVEKTSSLLKSPNNDASFSYNTTVGSHEMSGAVPNSSASVLQENLRTGLNDKLIFKSSKESAGLENENTKVKSPHEGYISSLSCENIHSSPKQTSFQQGGSSTFEEMSYLSGFDDSFSPFDVTKTITPRSINQNNPVKCCWDYLNLSPNSSDNSDDTFDNYKSSVKMNTDIDLKDRYTDDAKLESKPNPASPLPLVMRLGKHFNAQRIKNFKK
ncbi:uncharacterized protein LOC115220307 isoform X1 [Octopus sinensis]|uniref:Flap endonuclease GEN homolog 1 n=1 Tax=Octopus sinensis TaxID=2607531 RepID=A0A7E6FGA9_9MOLL|nr:uncharacterized protein LOC115220307 isoform X1 [Octopus sinensis]XP_036365912.1 uncharacterized protein LOC115220307 isoform X1 [Octopus sinensis]